MREAPTNKVDFYQRYLKGEFGNRPRLWENWQSLKGSDYRGKVTLRSMEPGGPCLYGKDFDDLLAKETSEEGQTWLGQWKFNESMPDDKLTIQGNIWRDCTGLGLEYSCEPNIGHRDAVKQPLMKSAGGLKALGLLKAFLGWCDMEDLYTLWEEYPDATIEFSTYSRHVGIIPHRNTVWWEVRNY